MAKRINPVAAVLAWSVFLGAGAWASQCEGPQASPNPWESAREAILAGDAKSARTYALQMLRENTDPKAWYFGNVVHEANQILGLAALLDGDIPEAKHYLLAAGRIPGSPQLDSFGPHMVLAQKLLARGEKEVVIEYLDLVAKFWASTPKSKLREYEKMRPGSAALFRKVGREHRRQIEEWKKQIRAGKQPELNSSSALF